MEEYPLLNIPYEKRLELLVTLLQQTLKEQKIKLNEQEKKLNEPINYPGQSIEDLVNKTANNNGLNDSKTINTIIEVIEGLASNNEFQLILKDQILKKHGLTVL